jgi:protein SCO1/2
MMHLNRTRLLVALAMAAAAMAPVVRASSAAVGVEEKLGQTMPLADLAFADEDGKRVVLRDLVDRPTVLVLVFFRCSGICTPLLREVARVADLADLKPGEDYRILTVSFDPGDTPALARTRKDAILQGMTRRPCPPDGWRFLTGEPAMIRRITDAAGFRYEAVDNGQSFNHPAVVTFLDRSGQIVRYLQGTEFNPTDFEMAVDDASAGRPRSIIQSVRRMCFAYDPGQGYVFKLNRIILGVTILFAAGFGIFLWATGRRRRAAAPAVPAPPVPPKGDAP